MTDEKTVPMTKVHEASTKALAAFVKDRRYMSRTLILGLLHEALDNLRRRIEGGDPEISWAAPYAQLEYNVDRRQFDSLIKDEPPPPLSDEDQKLWEEYLVTKEDALELAKDVTAATLEAMLLEKLYELTRKAKVVKRGKDITVHTSEQMQEEYEKLPEEEREAYRAKVEEGWVLGEVPFSGKDDAGAPWETRLDLQVLPLMIDADENRAFFPVRVGLRFTEGNPSEWTEENRATFWSYILGEVDALIEELRTKGEKPVEVLPPERVTPVGPPSFAMASKYTRTIYAKKNDLPLPLLKDFHELQTPMNWAVGLALFSLTDEDQVRLGNWHEAELSEIAARVNCLEEQAGSRLDRHDEETVLAEVVKLHNRKNHYYEIKARRVGHYWRQDVVIGSYYAIPELEIVFLDTETQKEVHTANPTLRKLLVPLLFEGRRIKKAGEDEDEDARLKTFPKGTKDKPARYRPYKVRWRWVQAFRDDLLLATDLIESGRGKGRPKRRRGGKVLRKGSLIRVAFNIFNALKKLRETREKYACRILKVLVSNINKTEDGIAAERVFRMIGLEETPGQPGRREDIVAQAVARLIGIGVLQPRSDTTPRSDPNPERRKGPFYRWYRSPEYFPKAGITTKEGALEIEKAYSPTPELPAPAPAVPGQTQTHLPGLEQAPIPTGEEIRAARVKAGITLRAFAKLIGGPSFATWSNYETGKPVRVEGIGGETWGKVRDFVAKNRA